MDHEHNQQNTCQYCPPKSNEPILTPGTKTKLTSFLGVCGCISCYVAMFPAILLGIIGVLGLSQSQTSSALNAYMASALFQPVLIVSILFLVAGIFRYGKLPLWFSILGGIGIFISMNFYMQQWLFTLSFALIALGYFLCYQKTRMNSLNLSFILLIVVTFLGVIDAGRGLLVKPSTKTAQPVNQTINQMDGMTK